MQTQSNVTVTEQIIVRVKCPDCKHETAEYDKRDGIVQCKHDYCCVPATGHGRYKFGYRLCDLTRV